MVKNLQSMMNYGLVALGLAWSGTSALAVELIYPDDELLVDGQTFKDLMQTRSTGLWTWEKYPEFNNGQRAYYFERRQGRTFVPQTIPADTFILGLRIANVNFAGASEDPCLNDRDYPFLEMSIDELDARMNDGPDLRTWFDGELIEDFDWNAARQELEGHILYPPYTTGTCIDPEESASGNPIEREIGWAGHYFLIPPLDPGVHTFQYFTPGGTFITREFTIQDGLIGDLDQSGHLDVADIDMLSSGIRSGSGDLLWDRDRNGVVNSDDRDYWVKDSANTWFGDSNLDGEFDSSDLVLVFGAGKYESNQQASWAEGNWNGDDLFDSSDLVAAFADGGYEIGPGPAVAAVPEPTGIGMLTIAMVLAAASSTRGRGRHC